MGSEEGGGGAGWGEGGASRESQVDEAHALGTYFNQPSTPAKTWPTKNAPHFSINMCGLGGGATLNAESAASLSA